MQGDPFWAHAVRGLARTQSGAVLCPPAFDPIPCWRIERIGARVFLRDKLPAHVRVLQRRLQ